MPQEIVSELAPTGVLRAAINMGNFLLVTGRTPSGEWRVRTSKGEITAEHLVLATGNYARQTGRLLGLNVPAIPVETGDSA